VARLAVPGAVPELGFTVSGWDVVSIDIRGHGDSQRSPDGHYRIDDFVADLDRVAAAEEFPPVFVGASFGGIVSLLAAAEHPGLASGLVIVDIGLRVEPTAFAHVREFMRSSAAGFESLEEAGGHARRLQHQ